MAATRTRTKTTAPVEEPEDEFEEMEEPEADEDLEELDEVGEDDEPEEAPTPKGKKAAAKTPTARKDTVQFGSPWLAQHVTEVTGEAIDSRGVRMLLRKLAKDGKLARVVGEDRGRYEFTGPNDPTVKLVVQMVKTGEAKAMRQAGLDEVKRKAAEKKAAAKAAKEAEAEEAEEEVEEAPKPRRTRTAAAKPPTKAAPAKATASRRRASASS